MAARKAKTVTAEPPVEAAAPQPTAVVAVKGFDKDFRCRGHQFEVGKTYSLDGKIEACVRGFHACENPFDVWSYYGPVDSRFAEVELSGATDRHHEDSKIAAATITIVAELTLPEFIRRAVEWVIGATKGKGDNPSGDYAQIGSSGDYAQIGSSGRSAQIGSSGDYAQIGSSGHSARIGSSGHSAKIGSSGDYAQIGSSGHSARIGSSGHSAKIVAEGLQTVIASAGNGTQVSGPVGMWVSLAEYDGSGRCIGFATGRIGDGDLRAGALYRARGGKLVEA